MSAKNVCLLREKIPEMLRGNWMFTSICLICSECSLPLPLLCWMMTLASSMYLLLETCTVNQFLLTTCWPQYVHIHWGLQVVYWVYGWSYQTWYFFFSRQLAFSWKRSEWLIKVQLKMWVWIPWRGEFHYLHIYYLASGAQHTLD